MCSLTQSLFFVFKMAQHKNVIFPVQETYILHSKHGHQIHIDFHLIPHIIGVYFGQIQSKQYKLLFASSSLEAIAPHQFTLTSSTLLVDIN